MPIFSRQPGIVLTDIVELRLVDIAQIPSFNRMGINDLINFTAPTLLGVPNGSISGSNPLQHIFKTLNNNCSLRQSTITTDAGTAHTYQITFRVPIRPNNQTFFESCKRLMKDVAFKKYIVVATPAHGNSIVLGTSQTPFMFDYSVENDVVFNGTCTTIAPPIYFNAYATNTRLFGSENTSYNL